MSSIDEDRKSKDEDGDADVESPARCPLRAGTRVFLVLLALGVVATLLIWWLMPPSYMASGYVNFDAALNPLEGGPSVSIQDANRYIAGQISRLRNPSILLEVLKSADVMRTNWYAQHRTRSGGDLGPALEELQDRLIVGQVPDSNFVQVSFRARDPKDAATIVNVVLEKYLVAAQEWRSSRLSVRYSELQQQLQELQKHLESARNRRRELLMTFSTPGVTTGINVVGETFRALAAETVRLETVKLQARVAYESAKSASTLPAAVARESLAWDPDLAALRQAVMAAEIELASIEPEGQDAAKTKALQNRLEVLGEKVQARSDAVLQSAREEQLEAFDSAYQEALKAELQLRERLVAEEARQTDIDQKLAHYEVISHEVDQLQVQYDQLLARTRELESQSQNPKLTHVVPYMAQSPRSQDHGDRLAASALALGTPLAFGVLLLITRAWRAVSRRFAPAACPAAAPVSRS